VDCKFDSIESYDFSTLYTNRLHKFIRQVFIFWLNGNSVNQRGNQNPYIEEEQTAQWPKEKVQKNDIKYTYKTKDRVTRTPLL
jgi:hypothetical protein